MATPIWLITGASSGFGHAIAQEALCRGHRVIATARSHTKLSSLKSLGASILSLDVTSSEADLAAIIQEAASIYGGITHVANCAGYILEGAVEETSQKEVQDVFNTNVFGTVNIARAIIPYLRDAAAQGDGCKPALATFGSLGSWWSGAAVSLYCSTKFAVTGLTEGLYEELKPFGINVCCVEPGYTRTGFLSTNQDGGDHRIKTAKQLNVYQNTVAGSTRDAMNAYNGQQPGDVSRCATAIVDVLTGEGMAKGKGEVPMRLVLGSDCLEAVRTKCETTLKLVKEWEGVAAFADRE
ncbi:putative oxidoreductase YusZ [Podospora fimiseda]|uniref:Oxidoreductase YusZ n=1 Tax=Podospora fimiseda TaxID=252190 RepID=A0AAN7BY55_9PEZI|nr:putative oxidoreductase YusZ [Podospora fimiseda]